MNKTEVQAYLSRDKPLFHIANEEESKRASEVGASLPIGDFSMAVSPRILNWIADHINGDMITFETGAGYTTVQFAALAKHHFCCTVKQSEADKITDYINKIGIASDKITFFFGSTCESLPRMALEKVIDFAYIDGCHGYPYPALDWHYIDLHLKIGGIIGMDNAELRPVREHCEFLEENGAYEFVDNVIEGGVCARFYRKLIDQQREWVDQPYSRAKRDPCNSRLYTRIKRKMSKWIKPFLY